MCGNNHRMFLPNEINFASSRSRKVSIETVRQDISLLANSLQGGEAWSSRKSHKLEFAGSNPAPGTMRVSRHEACESPRRLRCETAPARSTFPPTPASEPETSCSHRRLVSHDPAGLPRPKVPLRTATARPTGLGYAHRPLRYPIRRRKSRIIPQGTQPGKLPQELLAAQPSK